MKKFLFLIFPLFIFSQENHFNHSELKWQTIETEHFFINFHLGQERSANLVAKIAEEIYHPITKLYNHEPSTKVSFILKNVDDYSNGAAYFYDNKIEIWTMSLDFELRGTHNWLRNVVTHEFTHIIQMQTSFKMGRRFPAIYLQMLTYEDEQRADILYGYPNSISSYPISGFVVPSWFAEGVAQFNRPELDYDNWDSQRDMILRMYAIDNKILSWNEISTFGKTSLGNESSYNIGFAFVNYLVDEYGFEVLEKISRALSSPLVITMDEAIKQSVGIDGKIVYENWINKITKDYNDKIKNVKNNLVKGTEIYKIGIGNFYPTISPDKKNIAFISTEDRDYLGQTEILLYNLETKKITNLEVAASSQLCFSLDGNKIYYSKTSHENPNGSHINDIYEFDIKNKNEKRLTFNLRAYHPDLYKNKIAFLTSQDGTVNLEIFDLQTKQIQKITNYQNGEQLYNPRFSKNGEKIFCSFSTKSSQEIISIDLASGNETVIIKNSFQNRNPFLSNDEKSLYFASDLTNIFNIYRFDFLDSSIHQISNVDGGAFMPQVFGDTIFYSGYTSDGFKIFSISNIKEINNSTNYEKIEIFKNIATKYDSSIVYSKLKNYDDKNEIKFSSKNYENIFSSMSIVPVLRYDDYNKKLGTTDHFKFGSYLFSSDVLGKFNLFGGLTFNRLLERDLYFSFEFRDRLPIFYNLKLSPTLKLELFNITRESNAEITLPLEKFSTDVKYSLLEFDASLIYHIFSPSDLLTLKYRKSNYFIDVGSFIIKESQLLIPASSEKYLSGNAFDLILNFDGVKNSRLKAINPTGRKLDFIYSYESNNYNANGEYEATEMGFFPKLTKFNFHKLDIKYQEFIKIFTSQSLNFKIQTSSILGSEIMPDFFDFYAGGLTGMKGYNYYSISGNELLILNSSWRFPLFKKIDYRFGQILFDKLFASFHFDFGNAWNGKPEIKNFKKDAGVELRLEAFSFYSYPTRIFFNSTYGFDEIKTKTRLDKIEIYKPGWKFYFGILFDFEID